MNEMDHSIGWSRVEISRIGLGGHELGPVTHAAAIAGSSGETHTRENAGVTGLALSTEILDRIEELIPLGPAQVVSA
jgi:aryl-alcohol dehydrogenase-like predicted oxidoreductase